LNVETNTFLSRITILSEMLKCKASTSVQNILSNDSLTDLNRSNRHEFYGQLTEFLTRQGTDYCDKG